MKRPCSRRLVRQHQARPVPPQHLDLKSLCSSQRNTTATPEYGSRPSSFSTTPASASICFMEVHSAGSPARCEAARRGRSRQPPQIRRHRHDPNGRSCRLGKRTMTPSASISTASGEGRSSTTTGNEGRLRGNVLAHQSGDPGAARKPNPVTQLVSRNPVALRNHLQAGHRAAGTRRQSGPSLPCDTRRRTEIEPVRLGERTCPLHASIAPSWHARSMPIVVHRAHSLRCLHEEVEVSGK